MKKIQIKKMVSKASVPAVLIFCLIAVFFSFEAVAFANDANAAFTRVVNFILPWIKRLGGLIILIGGIQFGMGFKNDDAEGKSKGVRAIIAGCIVAAVGFSSDVFLINV